MAPMSNGDTSSGDQHTPPPSSRTSSEATPTRPTNNYASINTPIASAKRPTKKRTPVPSSSATKPMSSGGPQTPIRTPKMTTNDNNSATTSSKARYTNLSPMHNVKPVPRDSHHTTVPPKVKTGGTDENGTTIGCCISATESSLSIVTEAPVAAAGGSESPSSSNSASWVGRKVDAIFSPVLSFLNGASTAGSSGEEEQDGGEETTLAAAARADVEGSAKTNLASLLTKEEQSESEVENEEVQKMVREALLQVSVEAAPFRLFS